MKKLRLFATHSRDSRPKEHSFIATVLVRDGRILIEDAVTPDIAHELKETIEPGAYSQGFFWASGPHDPAIRQKPDNPFFLEALLLVKGFWWGKTYDGWSVVPARCVIIDE